MKSVAILGQGFVGGSLTTVLSERGLDAYVYDKAGKVAAGGIDLLSPIPGVPLQASEDMRHLAGVNQPWPDPEESLSSQIKAFVGACEEKKHFSGIFFVCLPTPMFEDGEADLSIVEGVLHELAAIPGERIAVVKSTVPPGSTERWNEKFKSTGLSVVHCPEFLREATALNDMRNQDRIILGGPKLGVQKVHQLFASTFKDVKIIDTSSTNSELTKYVTNCFLAMKVSFANELFQIVEGLVAQGLNVDYARVIECATLDARLGTSHWQVPSFEVDENGVPLRGFSLSCFPKDVNALVQKAKELGVKPTMLEATWTKNVEVRPQKDWEKMHGRAVSKKSK